MSKPHNIFISCSGPRSRHVAVALNRWFQNVLQSAKPWSSEADIDKGSRWNNELATALHATKIGISCLTPENLDAPWIMFEAGALSKTLDPQTRLCTYLLAGLRPQDVKPPLSIFQATIAEKEDTRKLVHAINTAINDEPVPSANLNTVFDLLWPDLADAIATMPEPQKIIDAKRPAEEMLAEILDSVRELANNHATSSQTETLRAEIRLAEAKARAKALEAELAIIRQVNSRTYGSTVHREQPIALSSPVDWIEEDQTVVDIFPGSS